MTTATSLAPLLERFFTQRLMQQRQASPHTISSYRRHVPSIPELRTTALASTAVTPERGADRRPIDRGISG